MLVLLLPAIVVSGTFTFGTFYSKTYSRIPADGYAIFHTYVINPGGIDFTVRVTSSSENFYVSSYPNNFVISDCQTSSWMMWGGKYVEACRIDIKITPKDGIVNGRYIVPVSIEALPVESGSGFQAKISQVRQINYEIDVYGGRLFEPPSPVEISKPIARITFGSEESPPTPTEAVSEAVSRLSRNIVRIGSGRNISEESSETLPESPPEPISPITGLAVGRTTSSWMWIVGIIGIVVVLWLMLRR